jgi:hypothetical protein
MGSNLYIARKEYSSSLEKKLFIARKKALHRSQKSSSSLAKKLFIARKKARDASGIDRP